MKKHIISAILLLCSFFILSGCGKKESEEAESITSTVQITVEEIPSYTLPLQLSDFLTSENTLDAAALSSVNSEAYAWLEVADSDISFPLLQSQAEEYYYLTHNALGEEDENGSIYTEYYNRLDFSDVNTVIYGRSSAEMFGRLHQFRDRDFFDAHSVIRIYLADQVLEYRVYAAYTYDDRHLIATYDFGDPDVFARYLEDVFAIRQMDAYFAEDVTVTAEDQIITLSTGVPGESDKRYLVQAVRVS